MSKGGEGSNPKSKRFGIHFGSIEIQILVWSRAIDTYFWIQTLGGRVNKKFGQNPYFHFFLDELPYYSLRSDEPKSKASFQMKSSLDKFGKLGIFIIIIYLSQELSKGYTYFLSLFCIFYTKYRPTTFKIFKDMQYSLLWM